MKTYTIRISYSHDDDAIRQITAAGLPYDTTRPETSETVTVSAERDGLACTRACLAATTPNTNGMLRTYFEVLANGERPL